jgi:zinc transport system ATP-binding protein
VLITAENLTVQRGGVPVLRDVSLTVTAGEIVSIIGPNGAGKTTLIRALLGLEVPSQGHLRRALGLRIGYVPQKLGIDPLLPLTAGRFLALWPGATPLRVAEVLAATGTTALALRPLAGLSGGELQRVLLARALINKPSLLVLDEPAQGLDVHAEAALYELIETLRRETGCGVLLVSHDLHLVMARTDRVLCLNGHICCQGHPEMVRSDPAYVAMFGSSMAAFALYQHHHDHTHDGAIACNHPEHHHHV